MTRRHTPPPLPPQATAAAPRRAKAPAQAGLAAGADHDARAAGVLVGSVDAVTRDDATPRAREEADAADVPDCIETAVAFMAAQDGAVQRVLAVHRRRPDGRCTGCVYRLTWWPCTVAGIAIRVEMANDLRLT